MTSTKKILVSTGGGDCPGLNAVIRGVIRRAILGYGWEVWGCEDSYNGLLVEEGARLGLIKFELNMAHDLLTKGGTVIGTTNKGGPFQYPVKQLNGSYVTEDRSDLMVRRINELGFDYIISIGGDGSQLISLKLIEKGLKVIGVPKTIDNDLSATDQTFGFQTAVDIATDAIDRLRTTGESHDRVMIVEVMGRDAGWIALHAGIAGGANVILIPEIPYNIGAVIDVIQQRISINRPSSIIVVAEGAKEKEGEAVGLKREEKGQKIFQLGGIAGHVSHQISQHLDIETRVAVLGHLQRGGTPCAFDRLLATRFGVKAVDLAAEDMNGYMTALKTPDIIGVPIKEAISQYNYVDVNGPLVATARGLGIGLGDIATDIYRRA
jgi:ATP-dependent phosphofructokinase / diphosphate-dependent phosphofructokinase